MKIPATCFTALSPRPSRTDLDRHLFFYPHNLKHNWKSGRLLPGGSQGWSRGREGGKAEEEAVPVCVHAPEVELRTMGEQVGAWVSECVRGGEEGAGERDGGSGEEWSGGARRRGVKWWCCC